MVVYWSEDSVEGAKSLDGTVIGEENSTTYSILRVFRALPTPIAELSNPNGNYLAPPELEKNFLISPPGSPPIGWEQVQEEPPNTAPLPSDLLAALEKLQLNHGIRGEDGRAELIRPEEVNGGVGVWVEDAEIGPPPSIPDPDTNTHIEAEWYHPPPLARIAPRTARPPMTS